MTSFSTCSQSVEPALIPRDLLIPCLFGVYLCDETLQGVADREGRASIGLE